MIQEGGKKKKIWVPVRKDDSEHLRQFIRNVGLNVNE